MRRIVHVLSICLVLSGCAGMRDTVGLAGAAAPLRLSRVVLYENGLAHFERRGRADAGTVDLLVPAAQVDDVLRSLTVVDGAEAAITGVRMLPSDEGGDVTLRVALASDGARDLRISYVTELPGWRPSYRLVVGDEGRVHVQGLAVVDNPTSESWQDVALTLSTEVPLSFRFDLRDARAAHRPHFGGDGRLIHDAPHDDAQLLSARGFAPRGSDINEAYGLAQGAQPEMSNRAGEIVGAAPPATGDATPADTPATGALLAFEQRPEAEGGVFGSVEGFDLGRNESGLVPFVDASTDGELALVYKPSPGGALSHAHPYRAVLFRNPSDAALLTGPVAIYAGDRYAGDGVTGSIPARAHAFVPYAIERSVRVTQQVEEIEDEVRAIALTAGVLEVELREVRRTRVTMHASAPVAERAFAFVAATPGYEPRALPEGSIATGQGYFLEVAIDAHGDGEVTLDLLRRRAATVNIAASPDHAYAAALLALLGEHDEVTRLRAIAERLLTAHDELTRVEQDLDVERRALEERRSALDALRQVASGAAIRQRLGQSVADGVARVDDLTRRATELHAEQIALGQEWYGRLRALTVASR